MELEEAERAGATGGDGDGDGSGVCSAAAGPDRLSSLPDCLLHTIMSFMKARQAVQTCVLSTRWRDLWRSVLCLDIDFDEFKRVPVSHNSSSSSGSDDNSGSGDEDISGPDGGDDNSGSDDDDDSSENSDSDLDSSGSEDSDVPDSQYISSESDVAASDSDSDFYSDITTSEEESSDSDSYVYGSNSYENSKVKHNDWEDFEDFTVNLMRRCNIAQLVSFRLHIAGSRAPTYGSRQAAGWLRRAMKYCAPDWPIQRGGVSSGSWPLKVLHLCHVFLDYGFMKRLNSVCCSLEDLVLDDCSCQIEALTSQSLKTMVLKNCRWRNLSVIASPTLKTLVIDGGLNNDVCLIGILAPALAYLHLAVNVHKFRSGVSLNEVPSVTKALIQLRGHGSYFPRSKLDGDQSKLLCCILNVTSLELSGVGSMVLGTEPKLQKFKNLRNLMLNKCNLIDDLHILRFFLQSSPILEKLILRCCKFPKFPPDQKKGTPKVNKTSSSAIRGLDLLCENLKVEIIHKHGRGPLLVQHLLRISVNLLENNINLTRVN